MTKLINGKELSQKIRERIKATIEAKKLAVSLAVVLVGNDPASQVYVRNKKKACEDTGIKSLEFKLDESTKQDELVALIDKLNADKSVNGILVQLPLPKHIDSNLILARIDPNKDVDGFHPVNAGKLLLGLKGLRSCTPAGVIEMIESTGTKIEGLRAVVIGRSNIVGKPVSLMLMEKNATVTVCHSRTKDLPEVVRSADIVVAAIGRADFVKGDWIKKGAIVIDVGINRGADGKLKGDVDFEAASKNASFITPVPGGVGPMTIAMLLNNVLQCAEETNKKR